MEGFFLSFTEHFSFFHLECSFTSPYRDSFICLNIFSSKDHPLHLYSGKSPGKLEVPCSRNSKKKKTLFGLELRTNKRNSFITDVRKSPLGITLSCIHEMFWMLIIELHSLYLLYV